MLVSCASCSIFPTASLWICNRHGLQLSCRSFVWHLLPLDRFGLYTWCLSLLRDGKAISLRLWHTSTPCSKWSVYELERVHQGLNSATLPFLVLPLAGNASLFGCWSFQRISCCWSCAALHFWLHLTRHGDKLVHHRGHLLNRRYHHSFVLLVQRNIVEAISKRNKSQFIVFQRAAW